MYQRILIPTDGSSYSEAALPHGLQLAKRLGTQVLVLYVLEEHLPPAPGFQSHGAFAGVP